jgi:hypothetical protein
MAAAAEWTLVTPDGRRLTAKQHGEGWSVAYGAGETGVRSRLEVALTEALLGDDSFSAHSMQFDYADWAGRVTEEIEREERPPDER